MANGAIDPVRSWHRLHPKQKEILGAAAVALGVATAGLGLSDDVKRYDAAAVECTALISALVEGDVLQGAPPDGLDLASLGIRQCRACGCTDNAACEGGCHWIEADLCSTCDAVSAE